jgi:hypothetical protein
MHEEKISLSAVTASSKSITANSIASFMMEENYESINAPTG